MNPITIPDPWWEDIHVSEKSWLDEVKPEDTLLIEQGPDRIVVTHENAPLVAEALKEFCHGI